MFKRASLRGKVWRRKTTQTTYNRDYPHRRGGFGWLVLGLVLLVVVVLSVFALTRNFFYPYPAAVMGPYYGGWFFFPFGFIFFFIFIFFIGRLLFWPFWGWGWGWRHRYGYRYGYDDAHEILRQRYAKGEITKDQFDQMMRDLEQHH